MIFCFFNDTATTEIYTLSLHDALPICQRTTSPSVSPSPRSGSLNSRSAMWELSPPRLEVQASLDGRSEEHTSELQSRQYLVCRLLLEKKKKHEHILTSYVDKSHHYSNT